MAPGPVATLAACAVLLGAGDGGLRASLAATAKAYYAQAVSIAKVTGRDTALDYYQRLLDDRDALDEPAPVGYDAAQWSAVRQNVAALDLDAAGQLMRDDFRTMASVRGLGETFVRSSRDGTMQAVAVYVPASAAAGKPAPLIVFLHGHGQSETELLAPPFVADLAERTGTIVVAPYGRGVYDYEGTASDVYDAFEAATKAFNVDPRKRYLAGYSMGGFSVFAIAPLHPDDWSAVMCVAGSLLGSQAHAVTAMLRTKPFYVLTGSGDRSIPTQYPTSTAAYLRDRGMDVSFYSQPHGIHRMVTLLPILTQAWTDMEAGIVRAPPPSLAGTALPSSIPAATVKN